MKVQKWKFVSREKIFDHPRMSLVEDVVELPNGDRAQYLQVEPGAQSSVGVMAINDKNQILLQQEYSYPPNEIMYQLPGGGVNEGEKIIDAANRELSEESGLVGSNCTEIGFFYVNNRRSDVKQYIVLVRNLSRNKSEGDAEEFIDSSWVDFSELEAMVKDGKITNINLLAALQLYRH